MADLKAVRQSFGRATLSGALLSRFYDIFLAADPEIAKYFANTDMTTQQQMLRQSLSYCLMRAEGSDFARLAVDRVRDSHSQARLNIPPRLYKVWKTALLAALAECDPKFDDRLAADWEEILTELCEHVASGYTRIPMT